MEDSFENLQRKQLIQNRPSEEKNWQPDASTLNDSHAKGANSEYDMEVDRRDLRTEYSDVADPASEKTRTGGRDDRP